MSKAEYIVDEGWKHTLRIADNHIPQRLVARAFMSKRLRTPDGEVGSGGLRLVEIRVAELAMELVRAGAEAWREGDVDLVAGRCWRCNETVFAAPFDEPEDRERLEELKAACPAVELLLDAVYSWRQGRWVAGCLDCRHTQAGKGAK